MCVGLHVVGPTRAPQGNIARNAFIILEFASISGDTNTVRHHMFNIQVQGKLIKKKYALIIIIKIIIIIAPFFKRPTLKPYCCFYRLLATYAFANTKIYCYLLFSE